VQKLNKRMKISIIIPVYNEEKTIGELIVRVLRLKIPKIKKEIIVVDDGSTDKTKKILERLKKKKPRIKIFTHPQNQGKGAAVQTGLKKATGDLILIQDADLEYDPEDIPKLLKPILSGKAEVVYGSRFTGEHKNLFFWHMLGNKFLNFLVNLLYNTTLSDMEVGYKLFRKEALEGIILKEKRWGFDPEITCRILKKGIKIYEVPISYAGRDFKEGKKIRWTAGFRIAFVLIKERLLC